MAEAEAMTQMAIEEAKAMVKSMSKVTEEAEHLQASDHQEWLKTWDPEQADPH